MSLLALWMLAQFGLAYIVGHSVISLPFRQLLAPEKVETFRDSLRSFVVTLLECPACFGFWAGAMSIGGAAAASFIKLPVPLYVACPLAALVTSGSNYLLARWTGLVPAAIEADTVTGIDAAELLRLVGVADRLEARIELLDAEIRNLATKSLQSLS